MSYEQLLSYFKNEFERVHCNPRIISQTEIKLETIADCKELCLLFFEEKMETFIKGYEMKKGYSDYKKCCQE
jgi:hypothetical protein